MSTTTTTATEFDQVLKKAIILLHSKQSNSATELRLLLDEAIKQRYGAEKMLCNNLPKQQLEQMESNFPGRAVTPPPQQPQPETEEIINLTHSPTKTISDSPDTIGDSDDAMSGGVTGGATILTATEDDANLKEFGDLNCCVCGEMMFTANNRLIECSKCGSLYHQECHKPPITNEEASEDQQHNWQCDTCFNKPSTSKAAGATTVPEEPIGLLTKSTVASSHSSSSSNSSSPFYNKQDQPASTSTTAPTKASTKHHKSSSSSSSKKSSSHSSSRSSSSKSSKHHESKRKSSK